MITGDFYKTIDKELEQILEKYKDDDFFLKQTQPEQRKSYAFLIWFLEFYGQVYNYLSYITDGDNDNSCDIVFDTVNKHGKTVFYIVQSKWNTEKNCNKEVDKTEVLKALDDFDTLIKGNKKTLNAKLAARNEALQEHLKNNGELKLIFLTLCNNTRNAQDNISSFNKTHKNTDFEVYDINKIKHDYIDRNYKEINPVSPLEAYQSPEQYRISIDIESNNAIRLDRPFEAYVFLIKPRTVFELFDKYGFGLFFKNVRNPLLQSEYNHVIKQTIEDNPAYFWYYNNGITAITKQLPMVRDEATTIEVMGLQIINGAQTVYSIYRAYLEANPDQREIMDNNANITLRLLASGGKDFDLKVTRYTNSQNSVHERDFMANDDVQVRLQNEFFATNYWYEKRRGEFRNVSEGVTVLTNTLLANIYLAFYFQEPDTVENIITHLKKTDTLLSFISNTERPDGLYEWIFNKNTNFENVLAAYYVFNTRHLFPNTIDFESDASTWIWYDLVYQNIIISRYFVKKYGQGVHVNKQIIKLFESGKRDVFYNVNNYINSFLMDSEFIKKNGRNYANLFSNSGYPRVKDFFEKVDFSVEEIENFNADTYLRKRNS